MGPKFLHVAYLHPKTNFPSSLLILHVGPSGAVQTTYWSERRCADKVLTIVLGIFFLSSLSLPYFSTRKKAARVLNFFMGS